MITFKTKTLAPEIVSEQEVKNNGFAIRFISFEAAIHSFQERLMIEDKPVGYRVTEQGIEILYK